MQSRARKIIKSHQPEPGKPLVAALGARLRFERKPTEWPGWIWCTDDGGVSAWVPEAWVDIDGDRCRMKQDYDSCELAVRMGETVSVRFEESGWAWVQTGSGDSGWIPITCLEIR